MSEVASILLELINRKNNEINEWLKAKYHSPPLYSSFDIRHSGYKIAPVDANLYPAGFNNLSPQGIAKGIKEISSLIGSDIKNIIILPENHTRNLYYLDNLYSLQTLLGSAGYIVKIGNIFVEETLELESASGKLVKIYACQVRDKKLVIEDFVSDIVICNNDFSTAPPSFLLELDQAILPSPKLGWFRRKKSNYFSIYDRVAKEFASEFNIDPFLITAEFENCGEVNFKEKKGLECVALRAEKVLHRLKEKYKTHNISDEPYLFIKANSGTYGMGIMTINEAEDIFTINKDYRKKMNVIKGGAINTEVLIQEGIRSIDKTEGAVSEIMSYMIGATTIELISRLHPDNDEKSSLNSPGMKFRKFDSDIAPCFELISKIANTALALEYEMMLNS